MTTLAEAHIEGQRRLRLHAASVVAGAWNALPAYNEDDVPSFLAAVLPTLAATQRASVTITNAFLARAGGRQPLALDAAGLTGAGVRNGTPPEEVYRRPFVTVWTALSQGTEYADAVAAGGARASSAAAMDIQLSMRGTLNAVQRADPRIAGYERVPDGNACAFCLQASGNRYTRGDLMPLHNGCGCGVNVLYGDRPAPIVDAPPAPPDGPPVGVEEHGELGLLLVNADDHFTRL